MQERVTAGACSDCVYLVIALAERARRDERRCAATYGTYWQEYVRRVPWRGLPGVY